MKYVVYALRSRTFCRVFAIKELYDKPIHCGTYKRLKNAKKKAREWRIGRVGTLEYPGVPVTDHGLACRKVWIEETE